MPLHFQCLILDHDDTAVASTPTIHYPAHLEAMKVLRPGVKPLDLQGWFKKNFEPGIIEYLTLELGMNEAELMTEYRIWQGFNLKRTPPFFPGFLELLTEFKSRGGLVTVVSHSEKDIIEGHYRANNQVIDWMPDMIFGWDEDQSKRKPSIYPVERILEAFKLQPREALIVDDLKPGVVMARAAGVPVAASGWGHDIPEIRAYMKENCSAYLDTVGDLACFIMS
jgi:phosphoglycolate phosphatase-like HAD superfamily hydrolase